AAAVQQQPGVQALPLAADVADPAQVAQAMAAIDQRWGGVDLLVNNAGVGMRGQVGALDLESSRRAFDINFWGALTCIEAVLPGMRARRDGLIINISSIIGRRALPGNSIYCASKFALNALSESLRVEARAHNVRVVSFYPGVTVTAFLRNELSGDSSGQSRGIMPVVSAEVVGRAIVRAAQREPRSAYATLFDRGLVLAAAHFPTLVDWALGRMSR
ncbi:MAG: SDR family oxidoreductase, partial [Caldilineales bacterium]|nr:SDR family oxidoreductase [Caldilineales bacterium]